ncbi:hypothetical protein F4782DRAFT_546346 [Xylaria castorea]|nr:hypothetical protein F4782DRAFT_546346 [Xylaria castorea]
MTGDGVIPDLRMSTAPGVDGPLIGPLEVRGKMRTYFSEVALWQYIGRNTYSIYFKYYNGASLLHLYEAYQNDLRPVPESFVWHVFLTLIEAVRYLHRGVRPGTDDEPDEWRSIYNRDIAMNNIFLHYPERPDSEPCPQMGFEENAFPEAVLGDFGEGGIHGDDPDILFVGRWNQEDLQEWQDTYAIFNIVKELCMAHVHLNHTYEGFVPEGVDCDEINGYMRPEHAPYSDDLFDVLKQWEFTNCKASMIDETQADEDGEEVANVDLVPNLDKIVNEILPVSLEPAFWDAIAHYRVPSGVDSQYPATIDVSWSKPKRIMPYEWIKIPSDDKISAPSTEDDDEDDDSQNDGGDEPEVTNHFDVQDGGSPDHDRDKSGVANDFEVQDDNDQNKTGDNSGDANYSGVQNDGNQNSDDESTIILSGGSQQGNDNEDGDPMEVDQSNGNNDDTDVGDGGEGDQDQENKDEDDEDEDDGDGLSGDSSTSSIPHRCPTPNPETNRQKLNSLITLEEQYPDFRPPHRVVMLNYRRPVVLDVKQAPDNPLRGIPPPPASTPQQGTDSSSLSSIDSPTTPSHFKTSSTSSPSSSSPDSTPQQKPPPPPEQGTDSRSMSFIDSPTTPNLFKTSPTSPPPLLPPANIPQQPAGSSTSPSTSLPTSSSTGSSTASSTASQQASSLTNDDGVGNHHQGIGVQEEIEEGTEGVGEGGGEEDEEEAVQDKERAEEVVLQGEV